MPDFFPSSEGSEGSLTRESQGLGVSEIVRFAQDDVRRLATPEGRVPGTRGHDAARKYLVGRLSELGLCPYAPESFELPYEVDGERLVNVIARLPGANPDRPPVLIAAHYDTCGPFPGADDNAAAIAIALAAVEPLRARGLERDVLFAFFDAEEPPHFRTPTMGSTHWYTHQRSEAVHCAIVMDLVGHDVPLEGLEDLIAVTGIESDPELAEVLRACEPESGLRTVATLNRYVGDLSDHHVFREHERPYLFLSCARWEHYHSADDTPDKLNYKKVAAVARYVIELTCAVSSKALAGPFEGYDTTDSELDFLRRHIGPLAASFGLPLESRADIDALTSLLVGQFRL